LKVSAIKKAGLTITLLMTLAVAGCRGPQGPAGLDASGVDLAPPTVKLLEPWPLDTEWDSLRFSAAAVDNVEILKVVFTVDGSQVVGGNVLIITAPPYRITASGVALTPGWHFVAARAVDIAGNVTDTPVRPVRLDFSSRLQDTTMTACYYNEAVAGRWDIPDSLYDAAALWVRFNPARVCQLLRARLYLGGTLSDTSTAVVSVWSGAGYPDRSRVDVPLPADSVRGDPAWREVDFDSLAFEDDADFFIVVALGVKSRTDTLWLGTDNGAPPWGRSGSRDDDGWHTLEERYGAENNLMVNCDLYYETVSDTSGGQ